MSTTEEFKQTVTQVTAETDVMPRWNFEKFYPAPGSPEFNADFDKASALAQKFVNSYQGKVGTLNSDELAVAIRAYKDMGDLLGKLGTYVSLKRAQDNKYSNAETGYNNKAKKISAMLLFFRNEIKEIPDEKLVALFTGASPALQAVKPWIDDVRRAIPHTPSLEVEKYMTELSPYEGLIKLFDDHRVAKKYYVDGKELKSGAVVKIISDDPDPVHRAAANKAFQDGLKEDLWLHTHIHNEIMRLSGVNNRWLNFKESPDGRHFDNNIDPAIVDAMEKAVKDSYERIPHRFYALKAKLMGQEKLNIYDRNINVLKKDNGSYIPFAKSQEIVLAAYRRFSPRLADILQQLHDDGCIDAPPADGKDTGAFAHPGAARLVHPMLMLNHRGTPGCVMTHAHEGGHGVHQVLAAHKGEPELAGDAVIDTPLTFAETASIFGEMLTFKSLLAQAGSDDERRTLLFDKVNAMINTVFRQISFYDFEKRINAAYKAKEGEPLTEQEMSKHWLDALQDSYGPAMPLDEDYGPVFGYIPHLIHTPFYVYAYAFGDVLVNSLYRVYEEGTVPDFEEKYIKMLAAGGTYTPEALQQDFGLDITDAAFWGKGLKVIEEFMDELETLCEPLLKAKAAPGVTPQAVP